MKNKNCVVTGGAGFIGSHLAKRLLAEGNTVHVFDDLSTGFQRNIPPGAIFHRVDLSDRDALKRLEVSGKLDTVFHFAAQSSGEASFADPLRDIAVNYAATLNILEWAEAKQTSRFIYASSMSVYGAVTEPSLSEKGACEPVSYYGCNKLASEKLISVFCQKAKIRPTLLRFFNVYGPGQNLNNLKQGMVSIYLAYLLKNEPVLVKGSLERFRDFIFIEDVVNAVLKAETCEAAQGEVFNVGTGVKTTVRVLLQALLKVYGKNPFDQWVKVEGSTPGDVTGFVANADKLKKYLKWEPRYSLEEGLKRMKQWADETASQWRG